MPKQEIVGLSRWLESWCRSDANGENANIVDGLYDHADILAKELNAFGASSEHCALKTIQAVERHGHSVYDGFVRLAEAIDRLSAAITSTK